MKFSRRFVDLDPPTALHEQCLQWDTRKPFLNQHGSVKYICNISFNISCYDSHERFMLLHQLFFYSFSCCDLIFLKGKRCITKHNDLHDEYF